MVELSCEGPLTDAQTYLKGMGGDVLNTAVGAARLGTPVKLLAPLGNDPFGLDIHQRIINEGIQFVGKPRDKEQTGMYFVSIRANGEREFTYYRQGSAASGLSPKDWSPKLLDDVTVVFSTGITLAISDTARQFVVKMFKTARQRNILTVFDLNYRPRLWKKADVAFDAYHEIFGLTDVALASVPSDTEPLFFLQRPQQAMDYFHTHGVRMAIAKSGAAGCTISYQRDRAELPAISAGKAIDTTGAGDAFNGGFLHGLIEQHSLIDCARLGLATAGLQVTKRGSADAMPYRDSVYEAAFQQSQKPSLWS